MSEKNKFNLLIEKIIFFQDINQKTILNCQKNKLLEIINTNDFNLCTEKLYEMNSKLLILKMNIYIYLKDQKNYDYHADKCINELQMIANDFSTILKDYGTSNLEDLLKICFGNHVLEQFQNKNIPSNNTNTIINIDNDYKYEKYELLKNYFHPISYKILTKKEKEKDKEKDKEKEKKKKKNSFKIQMNENFYKPLFQKTYEHLQPGGIYALNINQEIYESVCIPLWGEAQEKIPLKKSQRQNNYSEYIYVFHFHF